MRAIDELDYALVIPTMDSLMLNYLFNGSLTVKLYLYKTNFFPTMIGKQSNYTGNFEIGSMSKSSSAHNLKGHFDPFYETTRGKSNFCTPITKMYNQDQMRTTINTNKVKPYNTETRLDIGGSLEYPHFLHDRQQQLEEKTRSTTIAEQSIKPTEFSAQAWQLGSPAALKSFSLSPTHFATNFGTGIREVKDSGSYINAMKALQAKIKVLEEDLSKEKAHSSNLKSTLNKEVEAANAHSKRERDELINTEKRQQIRVEKAEAELTRKDQETSAISSENEKLRNEVTELHNEMERQKQVALIERNQLRNRIAEHENRLELQNTKSDELLIVQRQLERDRDELTTLHDELQRKCLKLEKDLREKDIHQDWKYLEFKERATQIEKSLRARKDELEQEVEMSQGREKSLTKQVETLSAERLAMLAEIRELRAAPDDKENDFRSSGVLGPVQSLGEPSARQTTAIDKTFCEPLRQSNKGFEPVSEKMKVNPYYIMASKISSNSAHPDRSNSSHQQSANNIKLKKQPIGLLNDSLSEGFTSMEVDKKSPLNYPTTELSSTAPRRDFLTPKTQYERSYSLDPKDSPDQAPKLLSKSYNKHVVVEKSHLLDTYKSDEHQKSKSSIPNNAISKSVEQDKTPGKRSSTNHKEQERENEGSKERSSEFAAHSSRFRFEYQKDGSEKINSNSSNYNRSDEHDRILKDILATENQLLVLSKNYQKQNTELLVFDN